MKINVNNTKKIVFSEKEAIDIFQMLNPYFEDNEKFLLESLSGPKKDCKSSIIGLSPILNLRVSNKKIYISSTYLLDSIKKQLEEKVEIKEKGEELQIAIQNIQELYFTMKEIENIFIQKKQIKGLESLGWFGYFGYDTIFYIENIKQSIPRDCEIPEIELSIYSTILNFDIKTKKVELYHSSIKEVNNDKNINLIEKILVDEKKEIVDTISNEKFKFNVTPTVNKEKYKEWFKKVKHHIDIGDIYQIQIGHALKIKSNKPPYLTYLDMREKNPSPYMYFFTTNTGLTLIGASPEVFINIDNDKKLVMRPIAGTIKKGNSQIETENNRKTLLSDEKEKAEHLMLVDLCRNDIARCCIPQTLNVDELMILEEYSHVIHIVSDIHGTVETNLTKYDVISNTFPAGTMTGTPKVRAIELIEETENLERGTYAGTIGFFGFNDFVISALCIRTASYRDKEYSIRASGGIVEDSTALGEWQETISKLSSPYLAITGRELRNEDFIN